MAAVENFTAVVEIFSDRTSSDGSCFCDEIVLIFIVRELHTCLQPSIVAPVIENQMPRPLKIVAIVKDPHSTCFLVWQPGCSVTE